MATPARVGQALLGDFILNVIPAGEITKDVTTKAALSAAAQRDVASIAALAQSAQLDRATRGAVSASLSLDRLTQGAVSRTMLVDRPTQAVVGLVEEASVPSQAAVGMAVEASVASQASITVPAPAGDWLELHSPLVYPADFIGTSDSSTMQGTGAIDVANEAHAILLLAPKDGTIAKVIIGLSAVLTAQQMTARIETLGSNGYPSGTLIAAGAEGFFTPASGVNVVTINTPPAVTKNQPFAIFFNFSGTIGSVNFQFNWGTTASTHKTSGVSNGSAVQRSSAGTWSTLSTSCVIGVEYGDGTMPYQGGQALPLDASLSVRTISDFFGNRFELPFKCKVSGVIVPYEVGTLNFFAKLKVIGEDNLTKYKLSLPPVGIHATAAQMVSETIFFPGDPIELAANETLRVGLTKHSGSSDIVGGFYNLYNAASREQLGAKFARYTARTGASALGTPTVLTADTAEGDNTVYNSSSVTLTADRLYLLCAFGMRSGATADIPTVSGDWEFLKDVIWNTDWRLSLFCCMPTANQTGQITLTFANTLQSCGWIIVEVTGAVLGNNGLDAVSDAPGSDTDGATAATSGSVTVSIEEGVATTVGFAAVAGNNNINWAAVTELNELAFAAPSGQFGAAYRTSSPSTIGYTMASTQHGSLAVGIRGIPVFTETDDQVFQLGLMISHIWDPDA